MRGKGTKLCEGERKVRLSQDRMPILGEGERAFRDYFGIITFGIIAPIPIQEDYVRDCFVRE